MGTLDRTLALIQLSQNFFLCWQPFRVHLKYIFLSHIFRHISNVLALKQTELPTIEMFRCSSSFLNPEPTSDIIWLEESGKTSLEDSVWPVEQASIIYQHHLSTLCNNEKRAALFIYYHMSITSKIDLDGCSMHPTITDIETTISV